MAEEVDYADYHRTVVGYHGTSAEAAERLVAGEPFAESDADDEWFGRGVYFWEHAHRQAWWWADRRAKRSKREPAVVGAVLRLGNCFDLLDPPNAVVLLQFHDKLVGDLTAQGLPVPQNARHHKRLDCAVFNYLYRELERAAKPLDTARAVYVPAKAKSRIYPRSWIHAEAHVQICVRNPRSVLAVWHVRRDGRYGRQGEN